MSNASWILIKLMQDNYIEMWPVILYLGLLSIIGAVGNLFVVFIYRTRFPKCPSSYFIICLAVVDFLTSIVGIPFDIVDIVMWYNSQSAAICKILRFVIYNMVGVSSIILVIVVVDRYLKICHPAKKLSVRSTKVLIGATVVFVSLYSIPALVIFGNRSHYISGHNFTANMCGVQDDMVQTLYPTVYYLVLGALFFVCVVIMVVMYSKIIIKLFYQNKKFPKVISESRFSSSDKHVASNDEKSRTKEQTIFNNISFRFRRNRQIVSPSSSSTISASTRKSINVERTTAIFFIISCVFIVSYLPAITLMCLQLISDEYQRENFSNVVTMALFQLFLRSYFLNSAVNPFVYGFMNVRFKRELLNTIRRMCSCFSGKVRKHRSSERDISDMNSSLP